MKKIYTIVIAIILSIPQQGWSQCTASDGSANASSCQCPTGSGTNCDLLPDITIAHLPLTQSSNYTEYAQVCNPPCSGNDGRLRLGVSTPIVGFGPLETRGTSKYVCGTDTTDAGTVANIPTYCPGTTTAPHQLINQRIYHKNASAMSHTDRAAGSMTYHASHGHQHIDDWGIYTLRQSNGNPNPLNWPIIGSGSKLGFCLLDISSCQSSSGYCIDTTGTVVNQSNFNTSNPALHNNYGLGGGNYSCSNVVQGISNGWMDTYSQSLDGMWIVIPPGICNGTYYVVIQIDPYNYFLETNENNNVFAVPFTLTKQSGTPVSITASGPTTFCTGGSVTLTATSGALNYVWSNGATTQSIVVTASGTFTVSCNTTTGCPTTSSPVTVNVNPLNVIATSTSTNICQGQSVQLNASTNASSTATQIVTSSNFNQYFIPDNNSTGVMSPITVSGISPATLSSNSIVSVTLNLTHTYDGDLVISLISPSGNQINLSNQRGGSGDNFTNTVFTMSATTPIASGSAPFTGSFIPDGAFSSLTGNANGTWKLKVVDVAANDTGRVRNWTLKLNNQIPNSVSYDWTSNPSGFTSSSQNPSATPNVTTTYTAGASDLNGCTGSGNVTVNVTPYPVVTVSPSTSICQGAGTTLTAGGATTYSWSPSTGLSGTTGISVTANPSSTTTYTVTGTTNGCSNTNTVTVTVNPNPVVGVSPSTSICQGTGTTLTASGATTYSWSPSTGLSGTTGSSVTANPSSTTTYTVTGTTNGCIGTNTVTVTVNPNPVVSVNANTTTICTGQSATITASGANTYQWSPATGLNTTTGNTVIANPSSTTTYTVTGSTNGCTGSNSITIQVNVGPVPSMPGTMSGIAKVCPGTNGVVYSVAFVSGALGYTWTLPSGATVATGAGTNTITVNFSSSFVSGSVCVTANNNCGSSTARCKTVTRDILTKPLSISGQATGVCNAAISYTSALVTGATGYTWSLPAGAILIGGQGTTTIQVQYPGGFTQGSLCVTADNNCGSSAERCVTATAKPAKPATMSGPSSVCANQQNVAYSTSSIAGATTYNWVVPGNNITSGQGTNSIVMNFGASGGNVKVQAGNACGYSNFLTKAVSITCKIAGGQNISSLEIYPNPAKEYIEANMIVLNAGKGSLVISDITGREVYRQYINLIEGFNTSTIDLKGMSKGIYFLILEHAGEKITRKLVID